MKNYLNFEKDIKSLENEIEKLQDPFAKDGITQVETGKLAKLQNDLSSKLNEIYSNLDPWQTTMVARHEDRPKSKFLLIIFLRISFQFMVIGYLGRINL